MLRKTEGKRRRVWQNMRWLDGIINSTDRSWSKLWERVEHKGAWCDVVLGLGLFGLFQRIGRNLATEQDF